MPLVTVYEHARYNDTYYTLDQKNMYIDDLKHEALSNKRRKFADDRLPVLRERNDNHVTSIADVVYLLNENPKDTFRSFAVSTSDVRVITGWRQTDFTQPLQICNHLHAVSVTNHGTDHQWATFVVPIHDSGFLEYYCGYRVESQLAGLQTDVSLLSHNFQEHGKYFLEICTENKFLVDQAVEIVAYLNTYREIQGLELCTDFDYEDLTEAYGQVRIY